MILVYKTLPDLKPTNTQKLITLNGALLPTVASFYNQLKTDLLLPDYFGNNLDALSDSLTDLAHLKVAEVIIIITNQNTFLNEETPEIKHDLFETIVYSVDEVDLLKEEDDSYDTSYIYLYIENTNYNIIFLNDGAVPFEEI